MSETKSVLRHSHAGHDKPGRFEMVLTQLPTGDVHASTWGGVTSHYLTMGSTPTGPKKLVMVTAVAGMPPAVAEWTERARPEARRPRGEWKAASLAEAADLICESMLPEDQDEVLNFLIPAFEET